MQQQLGTGKEDSQIAETAKGEESQLS